MIHQRWRRSALQQRGESSQISNIREVIRNGERVRVFEFLDAELTGTPHPVLVVSDGWDVLMIAEHYPPNWRDLAADDLFRMLICESVK